MILREVQQTPFEGDFVKVVVDLERDILAYGCELHIDCAQELIDDGSTESRLWGANLYPDSRRIDFVSMINIRPASGNPSMEILDEKVRANVERILFRLLPWMR